MSPIVARRFRLVVFLWKLPLVIPTLKLLNRLWPDHHVVTAVDVTERFITVRQASWLHRFIFGY